MRRTLLGLLLALGIACSLGASSSGHDVAYSTTASGGVEKSAVVCSSGCNFTEMSGYNDSAATRYIMLFDAATLPANGAIPNQFYLVAANMGFGILGAAERFRTGMVVACSTTAKTLTITATNDCFFHVLAVQ